MAILSETSKTKQGHIETVVYKLMNDQSVDETTSDALDTSLSSGVTMIVETAAGTNAGVVTLEGAVTSDYAGAWVSLGTVTTSAASTAYALTVSPSNDPTSGLGLPFPYIRARISTAIGVGSIDVYIVVRS